MVKFLITRDGWYPDQIGFLNGNYTVVPGDTDSIFETDDKFASDLGVLEKTNIVKIIREKQNLCDDVICDLDVLDASISNVEEKAGDPVFYYVHIDSESISFTIPEFGSLSKWREKLMNIHIVLSTHKKGIWEEFDKFIHSLMQRAEVVWKDKESEEEIYTNIILSETEKLVEVDTWEDFLYNPISSIIDDGSRIVKSSTISDILIRKQIKMSLTKVREMMRPYLNKNSDRIRIKGQRPSVWFFKEYDEGSSDSDVE